MLKGALKAPVPPLPRECRTPKTRPRTSRQDAGDAIAKGAQDAGAGIADGVQQFGKGIADGLKQLPEIKLPKFGGARNKPESHAVSTELLFVVSRDSSHLIIINTCHKQANKHFGEGYSCDVALYH